MHVAVVPFDNMLVNTFGMREAVLIEALTAHGLDPYTERGAPFVSTRATGRTFEELVRMGWRDEPRVQDDPTLLELVALQAHARYAYWLKDGAMIHQYSDVMLDVHSQGGRRRLILRSDSRRRDVVPFLELNAMHDRFAMIRCADDPPIEASVYRSSYCRSWEAIIDRITRWGVDRANVEVVEPVFDEARMVALQLLSGAHVTELGY